MIFQASSDTGGVLHLMAHSSERTLAGVLRDALLQLENAFSLVFLVEDRIVVARDPPGFRPLAVLAGDKGCYRQLSSEAACGFMR